MIGFYRTFVLLRTSPLHPLNLKKFLGVCGFLGLPVCPLSYRYDTFTYSHWTLCHAWICQKSVLMGYCEFICEWDFREQYHTDLWCTLYGAIRPPLQNASSKLWNVKKAPEQYRTKHWMLLNKGPRQLHKLRATLSETVGDDWRDASKIFKTRCRCWDEV